MRKNPRRMAWTVLSAAFMTFCLMAVGIPLGVRSHLLNATDDQDTHLQVIEGTVLVQEPDGSAPLGVTESATLSPGDEAITDATSRGILDLFERSHVTLYSGTSVGLELMQAPRFGLSDRPHKICLNLTGGLIRVGVALPDQHSTRFEVRTPHNLVVLEEGSYRILVTNEATEVTVVRGQATIGLDGGRVLLPQGTRARFDPAGLLAEPLPVAQNLVENGNFQLPLHTGWVSDTLVLTTSVAPPAVEVVEDMGRRAVRLVRREPDDGNHTEAAIEQRPDHDVLPFDWLHIALDVKLDFQSLSGGGQQSSEFPVIVRLDYKDQWGSDKFWTHGFYYQNQRGYPIAVDPWGQPLGEQIPRGVWYPYESDNLVELLGENRPARITGITIYASGWNYDSFISEIQIVVE
jgi:hypothetical protein